MAHPSERGKGVFCLKRKLGSSFIVINPLCSSFYSPFSEGRLHVGGRRQNYGELLGSIFSDVPLESAAPAYLGSDLNPLIFSEKGLVYWSSFQWTKVITSELKESQLLCLPVAQYWELLFSDCGNRFVAATAGSEQHWSVDHCKVSRGTWKPHLKSIFQAVMDSDMNQSHFAVTEKNICLSKAVFS